MRAPFNTFVTLYDGPGTMTPGFPRVVDMPARLVSDPLFRDVAYPLHQAVTYFTCDAFEPRGAPVVDMGGGDFTWQYAKADRAEFAVLPGSIWTVARVELCTGPEQAPYWRGHLVLVETPPEPECSDDYAVVYSLVRTGGTIPPDITQTSDTTWTNGGWVMTAQVTSPDDDCISTWWITDPDGVIWEGEYNGVGTGFLTNPLEPDDYIVVTPVP